MRFLGALSPHADYFFSFSLQSPRRSLLLRFARRVSSDVADQPALQRGARSQKKPTERALNDNGGAALRPDTRTST